MATVFMKWLETRPKDYDRGLQMLTLGRISRLKSYITEHYTRPGSRILEIGCGTGSLTCQMASRGALVTAIDALPAMLAEAERRAAQAGLQDQVTFKYMDAALVGDQFPPASFDFIVSTLVFSELPPDEQQYVLAACRSLLAPQGQLLIADEVIPAGWLAQILYTLVRLPLVLLTWLLTRTTTHALRNFNDLLEERGYQAQTAMTSLGGSLVLYEAVPDLTIPEPAAIPPTFLGRLRYRVNLRIVLTDVWSLFFRIMPPYPKVRPGLYAIGQPDRGSPVLVTGNFELTVRRLVRPLDGKLDAWLLVADTSGINVWCAAGGGFFTAEKVIAAVKSSHLHDYVDHHALVLPQLAAGGVDGWRVRQETGWGVHWGPVRAQDIPAYLEAHRKKTDAMRWVRFPLKDRLEMVTVTLAFYAILILLPVGLFWRGLFWPLAASLFGLSYFYATLLPWIPGRDGLAKSVPLAIIALAGLLIYTFLWNPLPPERLFNWVLGLTGLSVFTAAELQGMSPLMRGEQANWGWEAIIATVLGLVYWVLPMVIGWR